MKFMKTKVTGIKTYEILAGTVLVFTAMNRLVINHYN